MIIISNNTPFAIELTILKGTSAVREDLNRAALKVWLYSTSDRILCQDWVCESNKVTITVPTGLEPGMYGLYAMWAKNEAHVLNTRNLQQTRIEPFVAITDNESEATNTGENMVLRVTNQVATYGYDGIDAYEMAIMRGKITMNESKFIEEFLYKLADIEQVESDIAAETTAREEADAAINSRIDDNYSAIQLVKTDAETESTTRAVADSNLETEISTETAARKAADAALQTSLDDKASLSEDNVLKGAQVLNAAVDGVSYTSEYKSTGATITNMLTAWQTTIEPGAVNTNYGAERTKMTKDGISIYNYNTKHELAASTEQMTITNGSYLTTVAKDGVTTKIGAQAAYYLSSGMSVVQGDDRLSIDAVDGIRAENGEQYASLMFDRLSIEGETSSVQLSESGQTFTKGDETIEITFDKLQKLLALIEN